MTDPTSCDTRYTRAGVDRACNRPAGHDGQHATFDQVAGGEQDDTMAQEAWQVELRPVRRCDVCGDPIDTDRFASDGDLCRDCEDEAAYRRSVNARAALYRRPEPPTTGPVADFRGLPTWAKVVGAVIAVAIVLAWAGVIDSAALIR